MHKDPASTESVHDLVGRYAEAKSHQDTEAALRLCTDDFLLHTEAMHNTTVGKRNVGLLLDAFFGIFPDYRVTLEASVLAPVDTTARRRRSRLANSRAIAPTAEPCAGNRRATIEVVVAVRSRSRSRRPPSDQQPRQRAGSGQQHDRRDPRGFLTGLQVLVPHGQHVDDRPHPQQRRNADHHYFHIGVSLPELERP
jgi:hypothetical protein